MASGRSSRLAASFNNTIASSQVQGLLDGESITSVSGTVPQGPEQILDDVNATTHTNGVDHNNTQGPVRPEDLVTTPNHPPGIPNPAVNYEQLAQTANNYQQMLERSQMQNIQNVQTIQAFAANKHTMEAQMLTMQQQIEQLTHTLHAKEAEHARAQQDAENRVRQEIEERIRREAEANNPVAILDAEQRAADEAAEAQRKAAEEAKRNAEIAAQLKAEQEKAEKARQAEVLKRKQTEEANKKALESAKHKAVEEAEARLKQRFEKEFKDLKQKQAKEQAEYQSRLNDMAKEIAAIKEKAAKQEPLPNLVKHKDLGTLRQEVFNTLPGTVNVNRGGAVQPTGTSINWGDSTIAPPNKQVHFEQWSSTPRRPLNFQDVSNETITGEMGGPTKVEPTASQVIRVQHPEEVATAAVNSTIHVVANEFRKMKEPKLAKLKGGYTTEANLFFQSWAKEVQAIVIDRQMSDSEALQLVKEHSEGAARRQIDNYFDFSDNQTFSGLMKELSTAFSSCEDDASLMAEFYSRKQLAKENDDDFAEQLQLLARKVITAKPTFRAEAQQALKQQFANGLKDQYHQVTARSILKSKPDLTFVEFRSEIAGVLHTRGKRPLKHVTTNAVDRVECDPVSEPQKPSKRRKTGGNTERDDELKAMVASIQCLSQKIERMEHNTQTQVMTQAVSTSGPPSHGKLNYQSNYSHPYNNKYKGKPREPKDTPGTDGSLDLNLKCNYCGDNGHITNICPRIKARDEYRAAQATKATKPSN